MHLKRGVSKDGLASTCLLSNDESFSLGGGNTAVKLSQCHRHCGHLFGGRYKAQIIDERSPGYLRCACDYVHLNPARAGLVKVDENLESYQWSSYPAYLRSTLRPEWLRVDRWLGEHGVDDSAQGRRELRRIMEQVRLEPGDPLLVRRSWKIGAEDFRDWLADKLARRGRRGERASERCETDAALAERLVLEALVNVGWREVDLAVQPKSHKDKISIAQLLRAQTMTHQWIADRLRMGSASNVSNLLLSFQK